MGPSTALHTRALLNRGKCSIVIVNFRRCVDGFCKIPASLLWLPHLRRENLTINVVNVFDCSVVVQPLNQNTKAFVIEASHVLTHRTTDSTRPSLTSQNGRDGVHEWVI
jgi:hypothetical protein